MRASWVMLGCVLSLSGCRVGREIVGESHPVEPDKDQCTKFRRCGEFMPDPPGRVPDGVTAIDLHVCPLSDLPGCSLPSAQNHFSPCGGVPDLSPDRQPWLPQVLGSRTCSALTVTRDANVDAAPIVARSLSLSRVPLRFDSSVPAVIELDDSELSQVSFELHGPITLKLVGNRKLQDIRILADDAAQIEIEGASVGLLAIAADSGSVALRRVEVQGARITARTLTLESVALYDGVLQTDSFEATDATLRRIAVAAQHTLLASSDVSAADFAEGQTFTSVQGYFTEVHLASSAEPARLNGTSVDSSRLDGALVLDSVALQHSELGQPGGGPLELWDSALSVVSFCGPGQKVSLAGDTVITCPRCDLAPQLVELQACTASGSDVGFERISSCEELVSAPGCAPLDPVRMRPPK